MKKLLLLLACVLMSVGAYAQHKQGQSAVGLNIGYNFNDGGGLGDGNAMIVFDYRYSITDEVRIAPSLTYLVKNDQLSAWAIDVNAHYLFQLSDMFGFYPLAGLSLSFWKQDLGLVSVNETYFGANIGLGGEFYLTDAITLGLEAKYNIVKDVDAAALAVRIGYTF